MVYSGASTDRSEEAVLCSTKQIRIEQLQKRRTPCRTVTWVAESFAILISVWIHRPSSYYQPASKYQTAVVLSPPKLFTKQPGFVQQELTIKYPHHATVNRSQPVHKPYFRASRYQIAIGHYHLRCWNTTLSQCPVKIPRLVLRLRPIPTHHPVRNHLGLDRSYDVRLPR